MKTLIGVLALGLAVPAALAQVQLQDGTLVHPGVVVSPPVFVEPAPVVVVPAPGYVGRTQV